MESAESVSFDQVAAAVSKLVGQYSLASAVAVSPRIMCTGGVATAYTRSACGGEGLHSVNGTVKKGAVSGLRRVKLPFHTQSCVLGGQTHSTPVCAFSVACISVSRPPERSGDSPLVLLRAGEGAERAGETE